MPRERRQVRRFGVFADDELAITAKVAKAKPTRKPLQPNAHERNNLPCKPSIQKEPKAIRKAKTTKRKVKPPLVNSLPARNKYGGAVRILSCMSFSFSLNLTSGQSCQEMGIS
eukprot:SAG11_NODE_6283_length_1344_cov_1.944578_1_plen_113_part_00